ncbi:MAG: mechanosensitive ion channel family protein [Synechococcus sp.]
MDQLITFIQENLVEFAQGIIAAILILLIGFWGAKFVRRIVKQLLVKWQVDATLIGFLGNLAYIAVCGVVIMAALGSVGVQTASLVAIFGAAGLAIGLALQGSLSNFAAGVMMLFFRPFKVGDLIEGGGVTGFVEEIQLFTTTIVTPDNKFAIVPNAKISGDNIVNYSTKPFIRLDMVFGVGYEADIDRVKSIIEDELASDERILKDPAPTVAILELGDSSVNFAVRPNVTVANYWGVYFDTHERLKKRFDREGISIPFPQRDVHLYSAN